MKSTIIISGVVEAINYEKRDIRLKTGELFNTVHMWKTGVDSARFNNRYEWRNDIVEGKFVLIIGHMGNNGRIIAQNIRLDESNEIIDKINMTTAVIKKYGEQEAELITATPSGKGVMCKAKSIYTPSDLHEGETISLQGIVDSGVILVTQVFSFRDISTEIVENIDRFIRLDLDDEDEGCSPSLGFGSYGA